MRAFALGLLVALPLSATAQEPMDPLDFWPLEVGNVWEYEYSIQRQSGGTTTADIEGYERWTVVEETILDGLPAFGLSVVRYDDETPPPDKPLAADCVFALRPNTEAGFDILFDGEYSWCPNFYEEPPEYGVAFIQPDSLLRPVVIHGITYDVDAIAQGVDSWYGNASYSAVGWYHAHDIGITEWYRQHTSYGDAGGHHRRTLAYALVGGQVYGTFPVANEPSPDGPSDTPTAFYVERAYPNPFQDGVTVAFSLPAPEAVVLSLYDVRGRRVAVRDLGTLPAGSHRAVVDGTDLAPGLYLTRLTTGSGQQASHRVLRAD